MTSSLELERLVHGASMWISGVKEAEVTSEATRTVTG